VVAECVQARVIQLLEESSASHARGEIALALQQAQSALDLARATGIHPEIAASLVWVASVYFCFGQYREAEACAHEALGFAAPLSIARAAALNRLGTIAAETDDLSRAEELLRQVIDLYRQLGSHEGLFLTLHNLSSSVYLPRFTRQGLASRRATVT
jgi:tetratricopeptide (TPR) repeat protein